MGAIKLKIPLHSPIKLANQIDVRPSFAKCFGTLGFNSDSHSQYIHSLSKRGLWASVFFDGTRNCRWYSACLSTGKGGIFKGSEVGAALGASWSGIADVDFGGSEWSPYVQQFLDAHPYLKDVIAPVSGTLIGALMAWIVMPGILRRCHKYAETSLWGQVPYEKSTWAALEDPVRYLITFMAFSQIAIMVAPNTDASEYLLHSWSSAGILSFMWFLQRWKTNVISRALAVEDIEIGDRDRLLTLDRISSVGLFSLGIMALAEATGVAVQSMLTVGGIGGVATAFAARDILENILGGLSIQISQPFSVGDTIEVQSVEGKVLEMGLRFTTLLTDEGNIAFIPNSLISCQVIVIKSRAQYCPFITKVPFRIKDFGKIPQILDDIRSMLKSNPGVFSEEEAPYFELYAERTHTALTIRCNLKYEGKDKLHLTKHDILLGATHIIQQHGGILER